ncbi:MAG TPA: polyprenyl synthetase family protein [bacterium]|nr:polyprenyl synthetase family protein [bacterium]HPN44001.1 polyprenyl synthetase family protein [bacterium]
MDIKAITAPVDIQLAEFENAFNKGLHSNIPLAEKVIRYVADKKGKRLRPLLVFLTAQMHGGTNEQTLASSLVIELLHTATLIHDDVVDDSDLRRGSPTINNLWNSKISILIGDYLFSKTLSSMVNMKNLEAIAIVSAAANKITEGELLQMDKSYLEGLNEAVYFDLISKKTASLFSASCQLGALSVTDEIIARKRMELFGENLGIAFQITDDLLDYTGDKKTLGKPTGNDIRENKITLPLLYALAKAEKKLQESILSKFGNGKKNDQDVDNIISFTCDYGGIDYSIQTVKTFADRAAHILTTYADSPAKNSLQDLVTFTISRDK